MQLTRCFVLFPFVSFSLQLLVCQGGEQQLWQAQGYGVRSHTHTCMHACTHAHMHAGTHACRHACTQALTHARTQAYDVPLPPAKDRPDEEFARWKERFLLHALHVACDKNMHEHQGTCCKGKRGQTGCRMCSPWAHNVNKTRAQQLVPKTQGEEKQVKDTQPAMTTERLMEMLNVNSEQSIYPYLREIGIGQVHTRWTDRWMNRWMDMPRQMNAHAK